MMRNDNCNIVLFNDAMDISKVYMDAHCSAKNVPVLGNVTTVLLQMKKHAQLATYTATPLIHFVVVVH